MTMSRDLFLSILAMDAYNRGYDAKIDGLGETGSIGNATLRTRVDLGITAADYQDWQTASFYALAYTLDASVGGVPAGTTIISYRGTDQVTPSLERDTWGDLLTGWTLGAGFRQASQGDLSLSFFNEATGNTNAFDIGAGDGVLVTGHSLAGGLAGFVSMITGATGVGFDHMPYGQAAVLAIANEVRNRAIAQGLSDAQIQALDVRDLFDQLGVQFPSYGNLYGVYVDGEVNSGLRDGSIAANITSWLSILWTSLGNPLQAAMTSAFGNGIVDGQVSAEQNIQKRELSVYDIADFGIPIDSITGSQDRHSPSFLVILEYARLAALGGAPDPWTAQGFAGQLLATLFSDEIAAQAGARKFTGEYANSNDFAAIMRSAIAYSAIDEGTRVFGDTGIRALFNDANGLGGRVENDADFLQDIEKSALGIGVESNLRQAIIEGIVQFAGEMALRYVSSENQDVAGLAALNGILSFSANGITRTTSDPGADGNGADLMLVDLTSKKWDVAKQNGDITIAPSYLMNWLELAFLKALNSEINLGSGPIALALAA